MNQISDFLQIKTKPASCDTHGGYESRVVFQGRDREIWSMCPHCASEAQAAKQQEQAEKEAAERLRAWKAKLKFSGIPERFHGRTLESYRAENPGQKAALEFAQQFAENFGAVKGKSAIFCGKPGTGKTHLAIGIGMQLMERNHLVAFTTIQRMVRRVKDSWRNGSEESESDVIKLLVEPDLLILDEIGVQFGTEFERNMLFDILNERYEQSKSAILLSNLTPTEVKVFLGERVFDRLREDGGKAIAFDWESHRGKA